ncbi:MAG TPA: hypothetical protein VFY88_11815 [Intrasporangium sp.]|nr:hypothetical protein [Intrasporangium sp.]
MTLSKFLQSNERTLPEIRGQDAVDAEGNIVGMATSPHRPSRSCATCARPLRAPVPAGARREVERRRRRAWGDRPNPPVITAAVVKGLARPELLVEMDAIAVVPQRF